MSRKNTKQRKARGFPWPVLAFGGILLIVAAFLLANKAGTGSPTTTSAGSGGTPVIAVEPEKIDYGYVKFGNNETFKIKVTNQGDGVLALADEPSIEVLEGC